MSQHRAFQIKTMFLHIAEHFFDPHSASIMLQGHAQIGKVGVQTPGFLLTRPPMNQQANRINFLGGQIALSQPETFTGLMDETAEGLPTVAFIDPDPGITFLTQDEEPMPLVQLAQDCYRAKFAVADHENGCPAGDQLMNIGQHGQVFPTSTMSFDLPDPGPGNRNGSFSVSKTDHQQLMTKTDLGAVYDQADFSQVPELSFQPLSSDGFIPLTHADSGIIHQPAQSSRSAQQPGWSGNLPRNPAQIHRSTFINSDHQPGEVLNTGNSFHWSQLLNFHNQSMIESVDRHGILLFFIQNKDYIYRADQSFLN